MGGGRQDKLRLNEYKLESALLHPEGEFKNGSGFRRERDFRLVTSAATVLTTILELTMASPRFAPFRPCAGSKLWTTA
jgi:hypothetical protein